MPKSLVFLTKQVIDAAELADVTGNEQDRQRYRELKKELDKKLQEMLD